MRRRAGPREEYFDSSLPIAPRVIVFVVRRLSLGAAQECKVHEQINAHEVPQAVIQNAAHRRDSAHAWYKSHGRDSLEATSEVDVETDFVIERGIVPANLMIEGSAKCKIKAVAYINTDDAHHSHENRKTKETNEDSV